MFYLTAPSIQTNQKRKEVRDRSAEDKEVKNEMVISFESADRIEDRAERINCAAEDEQPEKQQSVWVAFINRIKKKNAHPAEHHVKHHLQLLKFFLINKRQGDTEYCRHNADRNADDRKRFVIGEYVENHQRYARACYQNKNNRVIDKTRNFFRFARGQPVINRRAAVKNNHGGAENY